ncbi:MAG: acyl-CoA dehydrogenase family protein, partial [Vicinamibacterales bacterium]
MTFDLTPEQQALVDRVRAAVAAGPTLNSLQALLRPEAVPTALVLEEVSIADAGLGAQLGFSALAGATPGPALALPGLLGSEEALAAVGEAHPVRARLVAAAVALGVARAAIAHAVAAMKTAGVKPGPDERAPHWVIADSATEVEAARMVTYRAAQALDHNDSNAAILVARAKEFAANAAEHAADAAIRMEG